MIKRSSYPPRISAKKLALLGHVPSSSISPRGSGTAKKRRTRVEKQRIYGTEAHIAWMKSLPCHFCRVVGYSEVAHVRNGGTGRKADARFTVPACGRHPLSARFAPLAIGCHEEFDRHKQSWRALFHTDDAAAAYAARWLTVSGEAA